MRYKSFYNFVMPKKLNKDIKSPQEIRIPHEILLDTNIIIDYLNGEQKALEEMRLYNKIYISIITYMEVLVGIKDPQQKEKVRLFLRSLTIVFINFEVCVLAVEIRQKFRIKLPDAIIWACAQSVKTMVCTRDKKDFVDLPDVRIPYALD